MLGVMLRVTFTLLSTSLISHGRNFWSNSLRYSKGNVWMYSVLPGHMVKALRLKVSADVYKRTKPQDSERRKRAFHVCIGGEVHLQDTSEDRTYPESSFYSLNEKSVCTPSTACVWLAVCNCLTWSTHYFSKHVKTPSFKPQMSQSSVRRAVNGMCVLRKCHCSHIHGWPDRIVVPLQEWHGLDLQSAGDYSVFLEHLQETKATDGRINTHGGFGDPSSSRSCCWQGQKPKFRPDLWVSLGEDSWHWLSLGAVIVLSWVYRNERTKKVFFYPQRVN